MSSRTRRNRTRKKNIDKYLKLSDFIIYAFVNRERLKTQLNKIQGTKQIDPIMNEIKIMLLNMQEDVDHEDVAKVFIE